MIEGNITNGLTRNIESIQCSRTETKRNMKVRIVDKNVNSMHSENNIAIKKLGGEGRR